MDDAQIPINFAALFENEFSLDWLLELTQLKASQVLFSLEEAAASGLVEKKGSAMYQFKKRQRKTYLELFSPSDKTHYRERIVSILIRELEDDALKPLILADYLLLLNNGWEQCQWLLKAGIQYTRTFEDVRANGCFDKVIQDLSSRRGITDDLIYIKTVIARCNNLERSDARYHEYMEATREALTRAKSINENDYIPLLELHLAKYERFVVGLNTAIKRVNRAYNAISTIKDPEIIAAINAQRPYFLFWQGRFGEVQESFERHAPDIHKPPNEYFSLLGAITVGLNYFILGQTTQGLGMLDSIRGYCLANGDHYMAAEASLTIALVMPMITGPSEAIQYAERAFRESRKSKNLLGEKASSMQLLLLYYQSGDKEKAKTYSDIFLKTPYQIHDRFFWTASWFEICWLVEKEELELNLETTLSDEIEWAISLDNVYMKGLALRYQALRAILRGEKRIVVGQLFSRSLKLLKQSANYREIVKTLVEWARFYVSQGESDKAEKKVLEISSFGGVSGAELVPDDLRSLVKTKDKRQNALDEIILLTDKNGSTGDGCLLFPEIIATANRVIGAERGALFVKDDSEPRGLSLRASKNLSQSEVSSDSFLPSVRMIELVIKQGEGQIFGKKEADHLGEYRTARSGICAPILNNDQVIGAIYHDNRLLPNVFDDEDMNLLSLFAMLTCQELSLEAVRMELDQLRAVGRLEQTAPLSQSKNYNFPDIVGASPGLIEVLGRVERVAVTNTVVMITGETGVGKELFAKAVHQLSDRSGRPLIKVNCAALTASLIESELFGHEKGAFTGASQTRLGRFEMAHGATLFLDEIGDFPIELQPKLLRVLQEGEFERVGGNKTIKTDTRLIVATNRDLGDLTREGWFRSDLWYRLNTYPIEVPPLRKRKDDIPLLVRHFIAQFEEKQGKRFDPVSKTVLDRLMAYDWPGNIRELENQVERATISSQNSILDIETPTLTSDRLGDNLTLAEYEREYILRILNQTSWRIEGVGGAAQRLGLTPSTLRYRMNKHRLKRRVIGG